MKTKLSNIIVWIAVTVGGFWVISFLLRGMLGIFSSGPAIRQPFMVGHEPHLHHHARAESYMGAGSSFGGLFLLIVIILAVLLLWKLLGKKHKKDSFQQFIDVPLGGIEAPMNKNNADLLDHWEKTINNNKEKKHNGDF